MDFTGQRPQNVYPPLAAGRYMIYLGRTGPSDTRISGRATRDTFCGVLSIIGRPGWGFAPNKKITRSSATDCLSAAKLYLTCYFLPCTKLDNLLSMARDRSIEFRVVVERLQSQHSDAGTASTSELLVTAIGPGTSQEFTRRAARVGHGIHATSAKLARLAQLARRTSVFEDPSAEISELVGVVKGDITALNTALAELQSQALLRNGSKDSGEHSSTVVDALKHRLMGATREFRDVLTLRQEAIKVHHNRRGLFSAQPEGSVGAQQIRRPAGSLQISGPGGLPTHGRPGGALLQTVVAAPQQDAYLASRAEALQQVERTIAELGGIFQQLASMVAEQGELAIRIDENLEDTVVNVESAQAQLTRYLSRVSGNRGLVLKSAFCPFYATRDKSLTSISSFWRAAVVYAGFCDVFRLVLFLQTMTSSFQLTPRSAMSFSSPLAAQAQAIAVGAPLRLTGWRRQQ